MKTKKRFLSILLSLALVLGMFPGMSLTSYAASSGSNGGFNWTLDDDGNMTVTGSGELPSRFINQNGNIKSVVFDANCQITTLKNGCIYWGNNITSIVVNSTVALSVESDAFRWANGSGSSPISITINAPKVTIVGSSPFFAYSRQLNITVNTNELIVYNGTMSYLGEWNSNNSFAYPANSTVYITVGYVFTESSMQEEYDEMAQYGEEDMFWLAYGEVLQEGRDYTYNDTASTVSLTSENAGTVFGGAQTSSSQGYSASHTHSFTYSASDATITATCTGEGCTLDDGQGNHNAPLTIVAPTLTTYGQTGEGISAAATLTGLSDFNTATGLSVLADSIQYFMATKNGDAYTKGDAITTGAPTGAGDYVAEITQTGVKTAEGDDKSVTASVGYTIAKADAPDITLTDAQKPTAKTGDDVVYTGQSIALVTAPSALPTGYTGVQYSTDGGQIWSSEIPTATNASDYTVKVKYTSNNYADLAGEDVTVTISAADSAVTKAPEAKTLIYNGQPQELITAGEADGGDMKYAVTTENQEPATDAYNFDNTSIPAATDAGIYYVWYKVVGDDNHTDTEAACVTVPITSEEVHQHTYAYGWSWINDNGTLTAMLKGYCGCGDIVQMPADTVTRSEEGTDIVYTAHKDGYDDGVHRARKTVTVKVSDGVSITAPQGVINGEVPSGEAVTLTSSTEKKWLANKTVVSAKAKTYKFIANADVTITVQNPDPEELPTFYTTLEKTATGKARFEAGWAVPDGYSVQSAFFYRIPAVGDTKYNQEQMLAQGKKATINLRNQYATYGANLSSSTNNYFNTMLVVTYKDKSGEVKTYYSDILQKGIR